MNFVFFFSKDETNDDDDDEHFSPAKETNSKFSSY